MSITETTDSLLDIPEKKPLRVEVSGTTEFRIGSSRKPITVDIAIGYRKEVINSVVTKSAYASLKASNDKHITLEQLIEACDGDASGVPDFLRNGIGFKSFSIFYGSSINSNKFEMVLNTVIRVNSKDLEATITIAYERKGNNKTFIFGGILKLEGGHTFDLTFAKDGDTSYMYAGYHKEGKTHIDLKNISTSVFGKETADKMPDVSFDLEEFKAFILYRKQAGTSSVLFGMGADLDLDLGELPMAGPILVKERSFAFKEVMVLYSKGAFTKEELKRFSTIPAIDVAAGFNISTSLLINGSISYYPLNDGADSSKEVAVVKPAVVESIPGEISSKAKWTKIDKKLGPVTIQRLGFLYHKGKVGLLLDASVAAAGMGMQLIGLGLGFRLKWPPERPEFYIDGLGLSYTKDPIRISGMFTRVAPKPAEVYSYYGSAQISFSKFNISGIGAYSKLKQANEVSLFIYAMYQGAIGGPSFFFVTGIAAGFGYNRKVRIPDIKNVNSFPLVAMALNPNPTKTLNDILAELIDKDCIPASPGDYWLALGIKFTSFKIIESFVLVIVQFGTRTEFTILGLSVLAWPDKNNPIAYIELALKANFGPDTDVMSVEAMLTSNSYVLDKNCKITGGFAFYAWVSGPHEGDFVITLGGYHPKFIRPSHYPDVQRLELNWKLSDQLQIKGGLYYALTPSCIMVGGRLEITYTLSFLRGSIVVWADMLISWAPFYYAIDIGISIRIEANIDMGLFYVRFNLEMGAQLHIYGPPFAGSVYVDWSIFAFTIPFGNSNAKKEYLKWAAFESQFIPSKKLQPATEGKDERTSVDKYFAAEIMITAGIITETADYIIVNPHKLILKIDAPVPVTIAKIGGNEMEPGTEMQVGERKKKYSDRNIALGIRPIDKRVLKSTLSVSIDKIKGLVHSSYAGSVPEALWSPEKDTRNNSSPGASKVLQDVLKGVMLAPKELPVPKGTPQFNLNGKFSVVNRNLAWKYIPALTGPDNEYDKNSVKQKIVNKLNERNSSREEIIAYAIAMQGMSDTPGISGNMEEWVEAFTAKPVLVQVGGLPQYSTK
ncbi:MAG: hypothetical protein JWQ38_2305 [Flavipsychrobacter sp.]|nr:hypothetical protein [Flavipsychrobacter sp.]